MSSTDRGTVTAGQDLRLVGPDLTVPMKADLYYSCQDPYAVRMSLDAGREEPVDWFLSRDLLAAALYDREGIGDVRAWPAQVPAAEAAGAAEKILVIELGSPDACARFEVSAAGIGAFLARTFELVPGGEESGCLDLDAGLDELLSQA